jgi:uncharacterized repeat protein (TIGR04052 family)
MFRRLYATLLSCALALGAAACGDDGPREPVEIQFAGLVGDAPFACGETYAGMGATGVDFRAGDFRFFVSDVRLLTAEGREVPVQLDPEALFQAEGVALMDFEDGTATCVTAGNPQIKDSIVGTVRGDEEYTGIRFVLGVPFDLNHLDPLRQPSPLNISAVHWSWARGYMFLRTEGRALLGDEAQQAWIVHTGSDGCETDADGHVTGCAHDNRPEVTLEGFDPASNVVVADLAMLLSSANLEATSGDVAGCEGQHADPDCAPIFDALGIAHGGGAPAEQTFFRVE